MHLKGKEWKSFWRKKAAPKVPEWPSYGNFCKVTQNPHFPKKCKGGTKGNFSKIAQKVAFVWKAQKHSAVSGIIPWKSAKGNQGKFFKNRQKSSPRFKGLRAHWRKWHYPLISIHLKCENWRRFRRKQRLQKCPNGQVMAIFARSPKTRIYWKSATGRPRDIFQKSANK